MSATIAQKLHWWKLRTEWYRKKLQLKNPPYFINLEPTGFCNLHCTVCSYKQERGKGYIDVDLARRTINDASDFGVSQVRFFLAGEPIYHPHLGELIGYAKSKGLLTQIHTNANHLDEKRSLAILESGLDHISFSFDGENKEEYEAIRVGGDYDRTLGNILKFLELKKKLPKSHTFVTFQVIKPYKKGVPFVSKLSPEFQKNFAGLPVDRFLVLAPFHWPGMEEMGFEKPSGKLIYHCPVLWQSLSVGWDGRVLGCCGDLNGVVVLGDVKEQRLSDIWNGNKIVSLRKLHLAHRHKDIPLCRDCDVVYVRAHPVLRDLRDLLTNRWCPI